MNEYRAYLGRVREVRTSYGTNHAAYHFAIVEPLLESDEEGSEWLGPIQDPVEEFPTRGRVYWHGAPPTLQHGSLWQFEVEERQVDGRASAGPELWQVVDPRLALEIVDVRAWEENALRIALTNTGLPIIPEPLTMRVALWLDDDHLLGPVRLALADDQRSWVLDSENLAKLPVWRTPITRVNRVECEGTRLFLSPDHDLSPQAGIRDWSSDEEIARTLLDRMRRHNRLAVEALQMTDVVFARYIDVLKQTGFLGVQGALDRVHVDRISALRQVIQHDRDLLDAAAIALLETPAVAARVDEKIDERVREQVAKRSHEVEAALAPRIEQLERARSELEALARHQREVESAIHDREQELARLREQVNATVDHRSAMEAAMLVERRRELEAAITEHEERLARLDAELQTRSETFEAALEERLRTLAERPETAFADLAIIRAALGHEAIGGATGRSAYATRHDQAVGSSTVVVPPLRDGIPELTTLKQVQAALAQRSAHSGLNPMSVLECQAASLAGGFPIICGERAEELVEAYASAIAGGRVLWVPIGASMLEPQQLLGYVDAQERRFVRHANGLAELLLGAQSSDDVHVVVFEGFNRAPVEGWLLPFLHAMANTRLGRSDRAVPLVPPGSVTADDPYADIARLPWPRNVLPVGVPTWGTATLPIPAELWRFGALIDADREPLFDLSSVEGSATSSPSRVAAKQWYTWQVTCIAPESSDMAGARHLVAALSRGSRYLDVAARMMIALRAHELSPENAQRHALVPTLVPRFTRDRDALERLAEGSGLGPQENWRTVLDAAERLCG